MSLTSVHNTGSTVITEMKQSIHNIYLAIAVHVPRTKAWKARKRQQACEESQGSIVFTRKFFIDDDLPLPAEFA